MLLGEAEAGDATARGIVEDTRSRARRLRARRGAPAWAWVRNHSPTAWCWRGACSGTPRARLKDALVNRVSEEHSLTEVVKSHFEPVVGALIIAFGEAGVDVDAPLLDTLTATSPPGVLFET